MHGDAIKGLQSRFQGFLTCHLQHLQKVTLCSLDFAYIKNVNQAQQKLYKNRRAKTIQHRGREAHRVLIIN